MKKQNTLKQIYALWYTQIERCDMKICLKIYNTLVYRYLFRFVCPTLVMSIGHPVRIQLTTQKNLSVRQGYQPMGHFLRYLLWTFFFLAQHYTSWPTLRMDRESYWWEYRSYPFLCPVSIDDMGKQDSTQLLILCNWKLCL